MASLSISKPLFSLLLPVCLFVSPVLGGWSIVTCEKLDRNKCAFAVSSTGYRCVLEKRVRGENRREIYSCRSSGVEAAGFSGTIETDECVKSCGLNRDTFGISSDSLLDSRFMERLCSPECYRGCPNVVQLYFNLAAGEGVFLPNACGRKVGSSRREMAEIRSSGDVKAAAGPLNAAAGLSLIASPPSSSQDLQTSNNGVALPPI